MAVLVPCDILGLESTGGVAGHDELVVAVAPKRATARICFELGRLEEARSLAHESARRARALAAARGGVAALDRASLHAYATAMGAAAGCAAWCGPDDEAREAAAEDWLVAARALDEDVSLRVPRDRRAGRCDRANPDRPGRRQPARDSEPRARSRCHARATAAHVRPTARGRGGRGRVDPACDARPGPGGGTADAMDFSEEVGT